jgi:SAM-dependent methyltransferase
MDDAELTHVPAPGTTTPPAGDEACWVCGTTAASDPRYPGSGLVRCPACGFGFLAGSTADATRALYGDQYFEDYSPQGAYDELVEHRRHDAEVRAELLRAAVPPPARLLELGCASGHFLAAAVARGYAAEGIEPGADQAAAARERAGVPVFAGTLADAALEEGAFDVVCGWHVLEHIPQPVDALRDLRRALRPGGALLLEVPNAESLAARHAGRRWLHLDLPHHVAQFGPRSLRAALQAAGFADVRTRTVSGWTYAPANVGSTPRRIAARLRDLAIVRTPLDRGHPSRHELLRAAARAAPA